MINTQENTHETTTWYIVLLQAVGGSITAVILLVFMAISSYGVIDEAIALLLIGLVFMAISYWLLKIKQKEFLEYFALVFALVGEALLFLGVSELLNLDQDSIILMLIFIYVGLFFLISSTLHRFVAAMIVLYGLYYFTLLYGVGNFYWGILTLLSVWLWLNEYSHLNFLNHQRVLGYAMVVLLLFFHTMSQNIFFYDLLNEFIPQRTQEKIFSDEIFMLNYYTVGLLAMSMILWKLKLHLKPLLFIFLLLGTYVVYNVQPLLNYATVSLLVLLLAFYGRNKILMGLGVLGMLGNIISFYYSFFFDFMTKAKFLLSFGVVLLVLALFLHVYIVKTKGVLDA